MNSHHSLRRCTFAAVLILMGSLSVPAPAKDSTFLAPDAIDLKAIVPPPPAKGSPEETADKEELEKIFHGRTASEIDSAAHADDDGVFDFITVLGPGFNASALPETKALFKKVTADVKPLNKKAKVEFARIRPETGGKPLTGTEDDYSYPSGHATRATLWASLLADAFPQKKAELIAQADQMGKNRVILGFHFPADIRAGQILGAALAKEFQKSPAFQSKGKDVQAELATVKAP